MRAEKIDTHDGRFETWLGAFLCRLDVKGACIGESSTAWFEVALSMLHDCISLYGLCRYSRNCIRPLEAVQLPHEAVALHVEINLGTDPRLQRTELIKSGAHAFTNSMDVDIRSKLSNSRGTDLA
jgi:hypothetical protein